MKITKNQILLGAGIVILSLTLILLFTPLIKFTTTGADIYDLYSGNFICSEVCFSRDVGSYACFTTTCSRCSPNSSCYDGSYCVTCDDAWTGGMLNGIPMTSFSQVSSLQLTLRNDFLVRVTSKENGFYARSYFIGGVGDYPIQNGVYMQLPNSCVDSDGMNYDTLGNVNLDGRIYADDICKSTINGGYYNSYTLTDYVCKSMTAYFGTYYWVEKQIKKCCADCLPETECKMSYSTQDPCLPYQTTTTTTTTTTTLVTTTETTLTTTSTTTESSTTITITTPTATTTTTLQCQPLIGILTCENKQICPTDLTQEGCMRWRCDLCEKPKTLFDQIGEAISGFLAWLGSLLH